MNKFVILLALFIGMRTGAVFSQEGDNGLITNQTEEALANTNQMGSKPEKNSNQSQNREINKKSLCLFFIVQTTFLSLVFFGYPLFCFCKQGQSPPLKGLNLPQGSIRAMIAIAIIGSYLITLSLGSTVLGDRFDKIIAAFGGLVGAVVGFYFGSRGNEIGYGSVEQNLKTKTGEETGEQEFLEGSETSPSSGKTNTTETTDK